MSGVKVSTKVHLGLRAVTELARWYRRGLVALSEVERAEHLSQGYLEQLIATLRRAWLVEGTRGAAGCYRLARHPNEITVGRIYRALEGPIAAVECAEPTYVPGACDREPAYASRTLWQCVQLSIEQVLDWTTLSDLYLAPHTAFVGLDQIERSSRKAMCTRT